MHAWFPNVSYVVNVVINCVFSDVFDTEESVKTSIQDYFCIFLHVCFCQNNAN